MSSPSIDLRHLRHFVAVVREGSFRAAASLVHVSQPPLTRQIQQLEEALGVQLLVRGSRGVEPTSAGTVLYIEAENILKLVDSAVSKTQLAGAGKLGRLDVGIFGSAVLHTVPRILLSFRTLYPDVEVTLHNLDRDNQVKALRDRRLTVGFNRFFHDEPGLSWETLSTERLLVAVPETHALSSQKEVGLADLTDEPLIFYPRVTRPGGFTNALMKMFHSIGIVPNVVQNVDDVLTAVALVSSGIGACLVVESACSLRIPGVNYIALRAEDEVSFDLSIIWRSDDHSALLEAFLAIARTCDKTLYNNVD